MESPIEQHTETQDTAEFLLDGLGLLTPEFTAASPEEAFMLELTGGKYAKLHNCEFWLKHQLSICIGLEEDSQLTLTKLTRTDKGVTTLKAPQDSVVRALLTYYLQMYYLPRFQVTNGRPGCDMPRMLDMMMAHETIRPYLTKKMR